MTNKAIRLISSVLLTAFASFAFAFELPVTDLNGKSYFYYTVQKGETVYSLTTKLGITRKQLVEANPSAADMLRHGETLYFPCDKFSRHFEPTSAPTVDADAPAQTSSNGSFIEHKVKKGETLYGISRTYDVDIDRILALNPTAKNGVKTGATLKIPMLLPASENPADAEPCGTPETTGSSDASTDTVASANTVASDTVPAAEPIDDATLTPVVAPAQLIPAPLSPSIAIVLPFMLNEETESKQAQLYTDFYRGFLMAVDTLSNRDKELTLNVYDTMADETKLLGILAEVSDASAVIGPEIAQGFNNLDNGLGLGETMFVNVFNVKDTLYKKCPNVVQTNTPHNQMYASALNGFDVLFENHTPVILLNEKGRADKIEFVEALKAFYLQKGIEPIEIDYSGVLAPERLEALALEDGERYMIVPSAGSLTEFNQFINAVKTVKDAHPADFALVGYPDWTAFRGDAKTMLHGVGATVFTRFFLDSASFDARSFNAAYEKWYGREPLELIPNQAVLGFDVGNMVIRNIWENNGRFVPETVRYQGIQSCYRFEKTEDGGAFNTDIFLVSYKPDGTVERLQ